MPCYKSCFRIRFTWQAPCELCCKLSSLEGPALELLYPLRGQDCQHSLAANARMSACAGPRQDAMGWVYRRAHMPPS